MTATWTSDPYRPIVDPEDPYRGILPGYAVGQDGVVYRRHQTGSVAAWIPLRVKYGAGGFARVRLRIGARIREIGVAALVLRAWVGPRPLGMEPLHFPNPDPANNRPENLRWARRGASKLGRQCGASAPSAMLGRSHPHAKLTEDEIPAIRALYRSGIPAAEIAIRYHVHRETIRSILTGKTWTHVPDPEGPCLIRRRGPTSSMDALASKLDTTEVEEIRGHLAASTPVATIAALYGVSTSTIRDIRERRTWRSIPPE